MNIVLKGRCFRWVPYEKIMEEVALRTGVKILSNCITETFFLFKYFKVELECKNQQQLAAFTDYLSREL